MKRIVSILLVLSLCLAMAACTKEDSPKATPKATEAPVMTTEATEAASEEFPFVGTWSNDDAVVYLRVQEDGTILGQSVLTTTSTSTVNGVTTSSQSSSVITNTYSWSIENGNFMFNGMKAYVPSVENGRYTLTSDVQTYYRVGDLDYEIPALGNQEASKQDLKEDAEEYTLGTTIVADGFELVLEECGIKEDIRISSKSSGIKITAGPSVEAGKQYVYLKGTLKNTGHTATRDVIGGMIYLDDYEFTLRTDTIRTSGSPTSSIDPLETVHILLYAQISNEMAGIFSEGKIVFAFNDNFANVELGNSQYLYYVGINR